ncbi:glycoside hydrolase family 127 protein [Luteococcus peritonei]|uniref:Glycoside hydrolase family 127 protein n=1 Tax=Luteococcus peritonei TaxID=88874 RepID=A0ABW4RSI4_9ACTN
MPHAATPAMFAPDRPGQGGLSQAPVPLTSIHAAGQGWLSRFQERNAAVTLPHVIEQLQRTAMENLRRIGSDEDYIGPNNSDADVYKVLEAIAWEIGRTGQSEHADFLAEAVELVTAAQQDDGYVNSWGQRPGYEHWSDAAMGHELFTGSALIKAAVALARVGHDELMPVARKWADLVVSVFGPEGDGYDGHPGIEGSLVELYRETGEQSYLDTARALLDRRGQQQLRWGPLPASFFQDHEPVREAVEALGHARRQMYLDSGVADVYAETGDRALYEALVKRWESAHMTKQYITGGLGSRHYDESFGAPYELPASRAYAETCASVAAVHVNHRLLLLSGEARYADAIEKMVYNAVAGAIGEDGTSFFSSNPLQVRSRQRDEDNNRIARAPWLNHTCCPTSLVRLIASLGSFVATTKDKTLSIQQYVDGSIDLPSSIGEGQLVVETAYPRDGIVKIRLEGTPAPGARLRMRVPGWCERHTYNGRNALVVDGYFDQPLVAGFEATLDFRMEPRFVFAHPRVDAVRGCRAALRGPVVYCAEGVDNPMLENLVFTTEARTQDRGEDELPTLVVPANFRRKPQALYLRHMVAVDQEERETTLIPYYQWANRASSPMRVWLPTI